jgi:RNA polymerase sigma factor (sigma-70 family)
MTEDSGPGAVGRVALRCQPDSRLVALTREGSDPAFEEVVSRYRGRLVGFAAGIARPHRAEDVVQESLVRALASIRDPSSDAEINLRPWLYTIVRNRALNDLRDEPVHEHLDESYDGVPQPPDVAAGRAELAGVVAQVKALPQAQREALVQRELGGRSHEDIAEAMSVTPGAVRGLIFRARSSLRNVAGFLIPMPILRALAGTSAGGGAATVAAAGGGGGGLVKLGATIGVAAAAIGSGVALRDRDGSGGDQATAKDLPKVALESGAGAGSTGATSAGTGTAGGGSTGGFTASGRDSVSGDARSGSSDSGSGGGTSGGGTGPSPASGSSGSGDDLSGGSGDDGGGGTGSGDDGGGGGGPGPGGGGPGPTSGGDGGGEHSGPGGGGGSFPTDDGGSHSGPGGGADGGLPPPPDGSGSGGGDGSRDDGGHSGSGDGPAPLPY